MKTAQQALAKWIASTQQGEQTWVDNLNSTQKPIVQSAINQRAKMQARFAAATAPGGTWERHLSAVGDGGIKQAATAKRANYTTGVNNGQDKAGRAFTKIINYINQGLPAIEQAKASGASGKTIMNQWFDYMSAGAGQLSADS